LDILKLNVLPNPRCFKFPLQNEAAYLNSSNSVVLDTSAILFNPDILLEKTYDKIYLPYEVIQELDNIKTKDGYLGAKARKAIRILYNDVNNKIEFLDPISLGKNDDSIIEAAKQTGALLLTNDFNIVLKCRNLNIAADILDVDMTSDEFSTSGELYSGVVEVHVNDQVIDDLYDEGSDYIENLEFEDHEIQLNQFVKLISRESPKKVIFLMKKGPFLFRVIDLSHEMSVWKLTPRNIEQRLALELLMDPDIHLVSLVGLAGSGKSLMATAAGLQQMFSRKLSNGEEQTKKFKRLIISRPIQAMGKDIGYLPGPQPLYSKILTPKGWTTMGQLKINKFVVGRDGKRKKIIGVYPKGIKSVYEITTTDGTKTHCCADHLWYTYTSEDRKRGREGSVKTTRKILETLEDKFGKINHSIPRNDAVSFHKKKTFIPAYVLGSLLGDGCFSKEKNAIVISNTDNELINRCRNELSKIGFSLNHQKNTIIFTLVDNMKKSNKVGNGKDITWSNRIKEELMNLNLLNKKSYEKFIPNKYKYSSIEDRIDVLRGLMDSDGTIKENGESSFATTSLLLAEDVQEIVRSLGGRATIRERDRIDNKSLIGGREICSKRISYEFTISLPANINPFYISRKSSRHKSSYIFHNKIQSIRYIGEEKVQCIKIECDESLYITDNFIVTHNTMEEKLAPWIAPIMDCLNFLEEGKEAKIAQWFEKGKIKVEAPTYIRGRSFPNCIMIIDECQNLTMLEIKTILTRAGENTKIILTGDVEQIDKMGLTKFTNGLTYAIERLKEHSITGHLTLQKSERSLLAEIAATDL
jgi:predicted ribonuclease YlaK